MHVSEMNDNRSYVFSKRKWIIGITLFVAVAGVALAVQLSSSKSRTFSVPATMAELKLPPLGNEISSSYKLAEPTIVNDFKATVLAGQLDYLSFTMVTRMKGGTFKSVNAYLNRTVDREASLRTTGNAAEHWASFDESVSASQLFAKLDQLQLWAKRHFQNYSMIVHTQKHLYAIEADYYELTRDGVVPLKEPLSIPSYAAVIQVSSGESFAVVYIDE